MRLVLAAVIGVLGWLCLPTPFAQTAPELSAPQDAPAAKGPQIEEIVIPIFGQVSSNITKPFWGTPGSGSEVFREIHALAREGIVPGPGQPPPKLRILEEFFAPVSLTPRSPSGLLGHYVFIVECVRSDLKHVTTLEAR